MAKRGISGPLMVAGDFNSVLNQDETTNYAAFSLQRSADFAECIHSEGHIDMGFSGSKLTWVKSNQSGYIKGARLDRALCNLAWRQRFLDASVVHLPRIGSDHAPLLIRLTGTDLPRCRAPFRFQAPWLTDRSFGWSPSRCPTLCPDMGPTAGAALCLCHMEVRLTSYTRTRREIAFSLYAMMLILHKAVEDAHFCTVLHQGTVARAGVSSVPIEYRSTNRT
nr:uncharacterized protein LOC109178201 [Ipomoea batatas]